MESKKATTYKYNVKDSASNEGLRPLQAPAPDGVLSTIPVARTAGHLHTRSHI